MARFSRYAGLSEITKRLVENHLDEGNDALEIMDELAIARAAANDSVAMFEASRAPNVDPDTRNLANQVVTDAMDGVASIALKAARIKGALSPAGHIAIIMPVVQRISALVYMELQNFPDLAEKLHRRIVDDLKIEISTPAVALVTRTVEMIDDTVPEGPEIYDPK